MLGGAAWWCRLRSTAHMWGFVLQATWRDFTWMCSCWYAVCVTCLYDVCCWRSETFPCVWMFDSIHLCVQQCVGTWSIAHMRFYHESQVLDRQVYMEDICVGIEWARWLCKVATGALQVKQMFVIQVRKMEIWEWSMYAWQLILVTDVCCWIFHMVEVWGDKQNKHTVALYNLWANIVFWCHQNFISILRLSGGAVGVDWGGIAPRMIRGKRQVWDLSGI